jgi:carbonic anhydrase
MDTYKRLLTYNAQWVKAKLAERPDYFLRLKDEQTPEYLWIGCSDSRVPAEVITGCEPGDLFVHRNIANLAIHMDLNLLTVVRLAVDHLRVKHVIVCGHYDCGGIRLAMTKRSFGLINRWLRNIKDVAAKHEAQLAALADDDARYRRLVELNVLEQVQCLAQTATVQRHWQTEGRPWLHGWVYDLHTGLIKELTLMTPENIPKGIYGYDFP